MISKTTNVLEKNQYIDRRCFYSNDLERHKKHQLFYVQEEGRILCCCSLLQKRKPTRVLHDQHRNASQKWENVVSSLHWPLCNNLCTFLIGGNANKCSCWASTMFLAYNRIYDFLIMFQRFIRMYSTSKRYKKDSSSKTCQKHLWLICFISLYASFKIMSLN